jgi:hypothetical protein
MPKRMAFSAARAPLAYIRDNCFVLRVLSTAAVNYAQTTGNSGNQLVSANVSAADFSIASGSTGPVMTVAQKTNHPVEVSGQATHIAITRTSGTSILILTNCSNQTLAAGHFVDIPSWTITSEQSAGDITLSTSPVRGINGHPFNQPAYLGSVNISAQATLIRNLNIDWYRTDTYSSTSPNTVRAYASALGKAGVRMLPIIIPNFSYTTGASATIYTNAFNQAFALATRCSSLVTHYDCVNEPDIESMINTGETRDDNGQVWPFGDPDGDQWWHYKGERYTRAREAIRGCIDGVKAANPANLTMVNTSGWKHTGFTDRLLSDGITWDVTSWHWYSEMGNIENAGGTTNVLASLRAYGKPMWIGEANFRSGTDGGPGEYGTVATYLTNEIATAKTRFSRGVDGLFLYELLDEPYFTSAGIPGEGNYGCYQMSFSGGQWVLGSAKPQVASAVRTAFGAY